MNLKNRLKIINDRNYYKNLLENLLFKAIWVLSRILKNIIEI